MNNTKTILKLENVEKYYMEGKERLDIIHDLNLEVKEGDFLSILGKSGSGKSTLLNLIGLLDRPTNGNIYLNEILTRNLKEKDINNIRNEFLGFVFQFHYLLPEFSALENIMIPALLNKKKSKRDVEKKALEILDELGLADRIKHKPSELSGGEKQRVAIGRAMINSPKLILADEPTGNLDEETSENIHVILRKINREMKQTIIVVTHSSELAKITDKKLWLKKGKLKDVLNDAD